MSEGEAALFAREPSPDPSPLGRSLEPPSLDGLMEEGSEPDLSPGCGTRCCDIGRQRRLGGDAPQHRFGMASADVLE